MTLSDAEALSLLTNPSNLNPKAEALRWQNRVRFHGLTVRDKSASAYWPTFKKWVEGFVIVTDKRDMFNTIFPFPVPTTRLLADVQDAYMKLFDAVNPSLIVDAPEGIEGDFLSHLDATGEPDFWPDESISALVESHEDILLIDIEAATGRPKPVTRRVPMDSVLSIELNPDATAAHLAYYTDTSSIVVVDDMSYRVYSKAETGSYALTETYRHNLGRCPARKLWDERVPNHAIASASIVDEVLSELDSYAFWYVAYEMFKLYGAFPIYYGAENAPTLPGPTGTGALNSNGTPDAGDPLNCGPCKTPAGNSFVAPGEFFEVPPGGDLSVAPVGIVEPSTDTLTFHATDIERLYTRLVQYLTGTGGESPLMKGAMNEKQVTGTFASKENVLLYLSRHLSAARQWSLQTQADLRYGVNRAKISFTFGTEFYLQTETELWEGLTAAKTAGSPQTILFEKVERIQAYRLRSGGSPTRSQLLMDLEPLREQSLYDVQALVLSGVVPIEKLAVKANFTDLIGEMERYFGVDITQIGSLAAYPERINRLNKFLYDHVRVSPAATTPAATPQAGGFAVGDTVMVKSGKEHMPQHAGLNMTIAEVNGDTYAVKLPGGSIHKWYTGNELMSMSKPM